jgi:hypothetical protein
LADPASSSTTPPPVPPSAVLVVGWPIGPDDLSTLCERLAALLSGHAVRVVLCDVTALTGGDLGAVDCLARLQLAARRNGGEIQLTNACGRLIGLLRLAGLTGVVGPAP